MASRLVLSLFALAVLALAADGVRSETTLLEFSSTHCGPCRAMQPVVDSLAAAGVPIRQVNVDLDPQTAQRFRVDSWPTFIALVDGRERDRIVGATTRDRIVEMLRRAKSTGDSAAVQPVGFAEPRGGAPATFAGAAASDAIVPIDAPKPRDRSATSHPTPPVLDARDVARLMAATVRLRVTDPKGASHGTGVIVDARQGAALIVTCGHLFRESQGKGDVEATLFAAGPSGAEPRGTLTAQVLHYDLERDLAVLIVRTNEPLAVAPVAPQRTLLSPGDQATAIGCSHGDNPTAWGTRVTAVNRYQGHPNVEAAGAPVEGRSGGPLFDSQGRVIGVCFAAEPKENEGLYASLPSIQAKLDELGLSMVYQAPQGVAANEANQLAAAVAAPTIRGQSPTSEAAPALAAAPPAPQQPLTNPSPTVSQGSPASPPAAVAQASQSLPPAEQAALEELSRLGAESEIICIIRPKSAAGRSEVIKIDAASPAFVAALQAARSPAADAGSPASRDPFLR